MAERNRYGFFQNVSLDATGNLTTNLSTADKEILHLSSEFLLNFEVINPTEYSEITKFNKFGRNPDTDILTAPEDVWGNGGLYTGFPLETETLEIFSSDINDTSLGTGARTITITNLLDANCNQMPDVTVTLNGTTPVSLGTFSYHRCTRMFTETAGSLGHNIGTITLRHTTTTANIFATIEPILNQTMIFAYTVPSGSTLYIPSFEVRLARANGSNGSANIHVMVKDPNDGNIWRVKKNIDITQSQIYRFDSPSYFIATECIDLRCMINSVSDNNTIISAEADGWLIKNTFTI